MGARSAVGVAVVAVLLAGCQLLPGVPTVDCGQVPPAQCDAMVQDLMEQARREYPGSRVDHISLSTPDGGYDVTFTDGTGFSVTP